MYFTPDWDSARESVRALAEFGPEVAITGHGQPMEGEALRSGLERLAADFDRLARPTTGRYAHQPAVADERGVVSVPPPVADLTPLAMAGAAAALGLLVATMRKTERQRGGYGGRG
jgi:hypothetical protein